MSSVPCGDRGDLVAGIERRQRGLDAQQEEVQAEIATMLSARSVQCGRPVPGALDTTANTLRELDEILLRDTNHFVALLEEIQTLAITARSQKQTKPSSASLSTSIASRPGAGARQRAWSEYYQYVHRYLRDVVRLDPDRGAQPTAA